MVRVHTTLRLGVVSALRDHVATTQQTQTEILAQSFLNHGSAVTPDYGSHEPSAYEAAGFKPPVNRVEDGRMSATFYLSKRARRSLDEGAEAAGFSSRSAFIDALLSRELGI